MPEELKLLDEWQKRLGLSDWYITLVSNCNSQDMELQDADGYVYYEETLKAAKITMINPETRTASLRPFDFEETLVHELLHLKFCLLERGDKWEQKTQLRVLHQIIDDLARAFVAIKREKEK